MAHGLENEARFLELLRAQHPFPGEFSFRVIHRTVTTAREAILAAVGSETGLVSRWLDEETSLSSGGRYQRAALVVAVERPEDVLRVYAVLGRLETVVSYL